MGNKIPTAEEFLEDFEQEAFAGEVFCDFAYKSEECQKAMIQFAKLHVALALKEASEKAETKGESISFEHGKYRGTMDTTVIDKESILKSYPLENIK